MHRLLLAYSVIGLLVTSSMFFTSCSDSTPPTDPGDTTGTRTGELYIYVGGYQGEPVEGVSVSIAGVVYQTDASGFVKHTTINAPDFVEVRVSRSGWAFTPDSTKYLIEENDDDTIRILGEDVNSPLYFDMVYVPPGSCQIGSDSAYATDTEKPAYIGTVTKGYYIGKYEVTEELWKTVMGSTPNLSGCDQCPIVAVPYEQVLEFCNKLSIAKGLEPVYTINGLEFSWDRTANGYRIPTGIEWEYAVRGDLTTAWYYGEYPDYTKLHEIAWGRDAGATAPQRVGMLRPNFRGLYDMLGNAGEPVWDWFQDGNDPGPKTDYLGPETGTQKVQYGGGFNMGQKGLRMSVRARLKLGDQEVNSPFLRNGIRLAIGE